MVDEELLKPSREHLALIRAEISRQQELSINDIQRHGYGSDEYERQRWREYHMTVEPLYREIDHLTKVMADYYALQTMPPTIIVPS